MPNIVIFDGPVLKTPPDELKRWEYRVTDPVLAGSSIQRLERRGNFRKTPSIIESSSSAIKVAYMHFSSMDSYLQHLQRQGLTSDFKQAIIEVPNSQFTIAETQLALIPISSDDEGYSSPDFETFEDFEAIKQMQTHVITTQTTIQNSFWPIEPVQPCIERPFWNKN